LFEPRKICSSLCACKWQFIGSKTGARFLSLSLGVAVDHFTVVRLVAWPLNESEAGDDLALIGTSLLFLRHMLFIFYEGDGLVGFGKHHLKIA